MGLQRVLFYDQMMGIHPSLISGHHIIQCYLILGIFVPLLQAIPSSVSSDEETVSVKEGETARLTCEFYRLDEGHAVMWKRDNEEGSVLFIDMDALTEDKRLTLDSRQHALTIENAEPSDSGDYLCIITSQPQITFRQTLKVHVPPSVNMVPEQSMLVLKPSEQFLQMTCFGSGNPLPQIAWRKINGSLPGGNSSSIGQTLSYSTSKYSISDMEGYYECIASNGVEPPARKQIKVVIHYKPRVKSSKRLYIQQLGDTLNITCEFSAKPQAQVNWYHNGFPIKINDPGFSLFGSLMGEWESSYLNILELKSQDLGDYECKVHNEMGTAKAELHVTTLPGPVTLMQESSNGLRAVSLRWDFESPTPPTKYKVEFKEKNYDGLWTEIYVDPDHSDLAATGKRYHMKYLLEGLEPGTQYMVRVVASNKHGFGSLPEKPLIIKTIGVRNRFTSIAKTDPPSATKTGTFVRPTWLVVVVTCGFAIQIQYKFCD